MNIEQLHSLFLKYPSVSTDTRKISNNDLYFALKGDNFNGNKFVTQALENGASHCIIDEVKFAINQQCILVENVLETLQKLAAFHRKYLNLPIIALTGSNGKTTTTLLTYDILQKAGVSVALGGNVGNSFAASVAEGDHDYYVLEISSFQLDDINSFKPHIAILCNITPDHLDRYDYKMENYAASKFAITKYQDENDFFIYNKDDAETLKYLPQHTIKSKPLAITLENENTEGAWLDETNTIHITINNQEQMNINELALQGKHNTYNSMASGLASKLLGIRKEAIRESLAGFESIEHRLEPVLQVYGMQFINDSKATNVNSTWYALENMHTLHHFHHLKVF